MKNIKLILMLMLTLSFATSCIEDDNDDLTGNAIEGGLVALNNQAIGYVVGNDATYTSAGTVFQGEIQTVKIEVFKSFTNSATGVSSNENMLGSADIANTNIGTNGTFSFSFTYEDLINGLTLQGSPLPANDSELNIGDFWTLRYVSTLSDGNVVSNSTFTKVSVGTRFAGIYKAIEGEYYRIGVLTAVTADWPTETIIESVDATTYRVVEFFGIFNGNEWYFQIDSNDKITYPDDTPAGDAQTGNGQPFISCVSDPNNMTNVPCGPDTNIVIRDDVNGKDRLVMTYGYLTPGSGPREFYHILEKI